jgi:GxxExxY protein
MLSRVKTRLPTEVERVAEATIGCAIEVHRRLGPGFREGVYQDAMAIELEERGLIAHREVAVNIRYRERPLRTFRLDLVVADLVIVELKAVEKLDRIHHAQVLSYLRATDFRLGLLINFNTELLRAGLKRVVL